MIRPLMALLLLVAQDDGPEAKKAEDEAARARRAALVDRIMAEVPAQKARAAAEAPAIANPAPVPPAPAALPVPVAPIVPLNQIRLLEIQVQVQAQANGQVNRTQVRRTLTLEEPARPAREDGEFGEVEEAPAPIQRLNLQTAVLGRDNFDRWVFGDGFDEAGRLLRLQALLTEKINRVMEERKINEAQLRRLRLAGSGDIKRFFDRVEGRRPEFEMARMKYTEGRQFLLKLEPLFGEFRDGPFGDSSIFMKTLKTIDAENRPEPR